MLGYRMATRQSEGLSYFYGNKSRSSVRQIFFTSRSNDRGSETIAMVKINHLLDDFLNPRSPLSSKNMCAMLFYKHCLV